MKARGDLTTGQLAAASGVPLETIRYYERIGLLPPPPRTVSGRRLYQPEHAQRLRFIRRGRKLGFSLETIQALLALAEPGRRSCDPLMKIAAQHLEEVRSKIADLAAMEQVLARTVESCATHQDSKPCAVLEVLEDDSAAGVLMAEAH